MHCYACRWSCFQERSAVSEYRAIAARQRSQKLQLRAQDVHDPGRVQRVRGHAPPDAGGVDREAGGQLQRQGHFHRQSPESSASGRAHGRGQVHRQPVVGQRPQVGLAVVRGRDLVRPSGHLPLRRRFGAVRHGEVRLEREELVEPVHAFVQLQHQQVSLGLHQVRRPRSGGSRPQMVPQRLTQTFKGQRNRHGPANASRGGRHHQVYHFRRISGQFRVQNVRSA